MFTLAEQQDYSRRNPHLPRVPTSLEYGSSVEESVSEQDGRENYRPCTSSWLVFLTSSLLLPNFDMNPFNSSSTIRPSFPVTWFASWRNISTSLPRQTMSASRY